VVPPRIVVSIDLRRLPQHIAIIMDGNGRWAQLRGQPRPIGHKQGSESVRQIVRAARRLGIPALTLYAFSEQNWLRPLTEVDALMELLRDFLLSEREEMLANGIRLESIGRTERLPSMVGNVLREVAKDTAGGKDMVLTLALSYGGREEIADAAKEIATRVKQGSLSPNDVNEELFGSLLPSMRSGAVDLLIRTGGEQRISNFLLWGAAYAELYFADRLWPEYAVEDLYEAIASFQSRDRRFGRVSSDAEGTASAAPSVHETGSAAGEVPSPSVVPLRP
jgi:undecaprenyl diphosphate synthase